MIARGSQDESEVRHHIAMWQGLIAHWNVLADGYRAAGRGRAFATDSLLREADRTRQDILGALDLSDRLIDNLAPGHDLRRDLFQIVSALECLSESIAISAEAMVPRIEASHNVAGLKYLLGALKKDAGLTS
ncbi:hypothetical protein [Devosia sp. CN2-171]|uniref:hypothetical protein n=1 Tax=Devosia sp. CN2-171 TaxID=3400909 RepID=UPI003BF8A205